MQTYHSQQFRVSKVKMDRLRIRILIASLALVAFLLCGCGGGAVIFAPTAMPPDLSPARYDHPSGAFSIRIPKDWTVYAQQDASLAAASFSLPDMHRPALTVAVINTGETIEAARFGEIVQQYQTLYRPDVNRYQPDGRDAMGDGSWRLTGSRMVPGQLSQALNTFVSFQGSWVAVTEVVIPSDGAQQAQLQDAVNTLVLNTGADLQPTSIETLSLVRANRFGLQNMTAWNNPAGALFVTGEVGNYGIQPTAPLVVRVALLTDEGQIAEAVDTTMGYGIPANGFAPFSVRFGEGIASGNARYSVTLLSENPDGAPPVFAGQGILNWEDASSFDDDGTLHVGGSVTNNGESPVRAVLGIITVFDAQQKVIGAWFAPLSADALEPEASLDFDIRVPEIGGEPMNYILEIQGLMEADS